MEILLCVVIPVAYIIVGAVVIGFLERQQPSDPKLPRHQMLGFALIWPVFATFALGEMVFNGLGRIIDSIAGSKKAEPTQPKPTSAVD